MSSNTFNPRRNQALAQAEQASPLLLLSSLDITSDWDEEKLVMVFDDGSTVKVVVPCNDMSTPEVFLHTHNEFLEAAVVLHLEDDELFQHYRRTLRGAARMNWDTSTAAFPRTDAGFEDAMEAFKRTLMTDDAHDNLMHYLELAVKPRSMDAKAVMNRLQLINLFSTRLPNPTGAAAPVIGTVQLKTMFFRMMPMAWQNKFKESGSRLVNYTPLELAEYMNTLSTIETTGRNGNAGPTSTSRRAAGNRGQRGGRGHGGRGPRANHRGGRGGNFDFLRQGRSRDDNRDANPRDRSRPRRSGNGVGGHIERPRNDEVCRIHGGHTWIQCHLNPNGNSYRPRGGRGGNNSSDRNQHHGGRGPQAYHVGGANRFSGNRPEQQQMPRDVPRDQRQHGRDRN